MQTIPVHSCRILCWHELVLAIGYISIIGLLVRLQALNFGTLEQHEASQHPILKSLTFAFTVILHSSGVDLVAMHPEATARGIGTVLLRRPICRLRFLAVRTPTAALSPSITGEH